MTILYGIKDPAEVLDYQVDWSSSLAAGESIATSTWTPVHQDDGSADTRITVTNQTSTATATTVWLSGGMVGDSTHTIVNHISTNQGRQFDQTLYIDIFEK